MIVTTAPTVTYQQPTVVSAMPTESEEMMYKGSIVAAGVGFVFLAAMEISVVAKNNDGGGFRLLVPLLVTSCLFFTLAAALGYLGYKKQKHGGSFKIVIAVFIALISVLTIIICAVVASRDNSYWGQAISDAFLYVIFIGIGATAIGILACIACIVVDTSSSNNVVLVNGPAPVYQPVQHHMLPVQAQCVPVQHHPQPVHHQPQDQLIMVN